MNFRDAAREYYDIYSWTTTPLALDDNGKPKRPFVDQWQHTPHEWDAIAAQPWERARGIGVLLGPASRNLAVIDLDDNELARAVLAKLREGKREHYWVETGRKNGHLYLYEETPSEPHNFWTDFASKRIKIELKAHGQQVAGPPTPGYTALWADTPALVHEGVRGAWDAIAAVLGLSSPERAENGLNHFPRPWSPHVTEGERNEAVYVESHKLREAGVPLELAIDIMLARVRAAYDVARFPDREVTRTVRSAYRKGEIKVFVGWV